MSIWRRLQNLRVTEEWSLTPSFPQQTIRLTYGFSDNCHSIQVGRSPNLYPVELFGQRSFIVKPQAEIWTVPTGAPTEFDALAFKALPQVLDRPATVFVLIDVLLGSEPDPEAPPEPTWTDATLLNGWQNIGDIYFLTSFLKLNGFVYLRGTLSGLEAYDKAIFNLPEGYRPDKTLLLGVTAGATGTSLAGTWIAVGPTGLVSKFDDALDYVSIDGLAFKV